MLTLILTPKPYLGFYYAMTFYTDLNLETRILSPGP